MICDIYDNVLESHVAELIDMEMKEITWQYDYKSHGKEVNKHWHTLCAVSYTHLTLPTNC